MKIMQLRAAKASLSAVGEATTITKHGKPAAVVVPIEDARRLYPDDRPSLWTLLKAIPHDLEIERDQTPLRVPDL